MNDVEGPYELPEGWEWTRIGEVCGLINGRAFKSNEWSPEGLPIIRIQNLNNPDAEFNYCNFEVDEKYRVNKGQLLFAWSGTPGTSFGAHIWKGDDAYLNQHIFKIKLNENFLDKLFFMYLINRNVFEYIQKAHGTAGLAHITKKKFETSLIPLPPLPEQHRIVARIEELFTQLDAGVSALEKAQAQLKRYRQSVLKAAVEGRLTEDWRRGHPDVEPASELLERILKERRDKWEGEGLAKLVAKGKRPKNDRWKQKYKKPQAPDTDGLPELPEGWMWAELNTVCQDITDGDHQAPPKSQEGVPFLVISNIREGKLDFDNTRFVPRSYYEAIPLIRKPVKGDILYSLVGSYGFPVIVDIEKEFCFQRHIGLIRPNKQINIKYLFYFLKSHLAFNQATKVATGTAQLTVPLSGLRRFNVPLPPLAEQHEIVSEIERRLSVADQTEATTAANLKRAARLRQSLLKKAFRGELVPQDPDDEPASALLEKIRAERAKTQPKKRRGRPRKNKTATQTELI